MGNITKQMFIGKKIAIIDAKNKTLQGLQGIIVDETKQTFMIQENQNVKRVLKEGIVLELLDTHVRINGDQIIGRPEERMKRKSK